jgi:hypothetical protein
MSGEELFKVSSKGDFDEANRLLLEGADVDYKENVSY